MYELRQSISVVITILMVDATDDETAETGKSLTVYISKNGGAFTTTTNSAVEISRGWYQLTLTATEVNTLGALIIEADASGCDTWRTVYNVVAATPEVSLPDGAITANKIAADAFTAAKFAADVTTELQAGLATAAALTTLTNYVDAEVATILAAVDTEVAAILAKVNNLPASPAAVGSAMTLAADAVNSSSVAATAVTELQAGLATASALATLTAYVDTEVAAILAVVDTEVAAILAKVNNLPASPAAVGSAMTVSDKTGFKLAADGLDSISITAPTGVASNFREMWVQVWRLFFKRVTETAAERKTYADDGATVLTTQTLSDNGTTQEQSAAS